MTTVTIDLTSEQTIAAAVAQLDAQARDWLATALRDQLSAENYQQILDGIRARLAEYPHGDADEMVGVLFTTDDDEDGFFLKTHGDVLFTDGTTDHIDFPELYDPLTREFGARGRTFTLAVDLRTGDMEEDDYGKHRDIRTHFATPGPTQENAS